MPALYNYRLFISHAWSYGEDYIRVKSFMDAASNFLYSNYSVPVSKAFEGLNSVQLGDQIKRQINPVQVVVILGGMYVAHSDWIQFEIDHAIAMSKPILGIRPHGAERMPLALTSVASVVVGWNTDSIVTAIRDLVP